MTDFARSSKISPSASSALPTMLLVVVVVAALYFAREVLVPIALALLLSFVLAPLVRILRNWYVPRALAVVVAVIVAFAGNFWLRRFDGFAGHSACDRSSGISVDFT